MCRRPLALGTLALAIGWGPALADGNSQNDANNPLTPKITTNFHDYYIPSFNGLHNARANQFLLRGLIPSDMFGAPQLLRYTLPIEKVPTIEGSDFGLGDLTLMDLFMSPGKEISFGAGPILIAPTATTATLGAGKWQAGAAAIAVAPQSWGLLAMLATFQQSFTGQREREDVSLITAQPIIIYNLPEGYHLRSSATWNFDLHAGTNYIPVGLGAGKVWLLNSGTTANAFIEPQYTVSHDGAGSPAWQYSAVSICNSRSSVSQ
jgi:hypothetical protein